MPHNSKYLDMIYEGPNPYCQCPLSGSQTMPVCDIFNASNAGDSNINRSKQMMLTALPTGLTCHWTFRVNHYFE